MAQGVVGCAYAGEGGAEDEDCVGLHVCGAENGR